MPTKSYPTLLIKSGPAIYEVSLLLPPLPADTARGG